LLRRVGDDDPAGALLFRLLDALHDQAVVEWTNVDCHVTKTSLPVPTEGPGCVVWMELFRNALARAAPTKTVAPSGQGGSMGFCSATRRRRRPPVGSDAATGSEPGCGRTKTPGRTRRCVSYAPRWPAWPLDDRPHPMLLLHQRDGWIREGTCVASTRLPARH